MDTITLSHSAPAALSKAGIVSYPSQEVAGATPTADVISVFDVTTATALVLGTDYTLTASGSSPETLTYSVTRVNSSSASADADTARVTYRYGVQPSVNYNLGEFQGEPGAAPAGTAFKGSNQATSGSTAAGIGDQAAGGSLTDPANTVKGSETGAPGSEYTVTPRAPGNFGWPLGSPDTEAVYGGGQPASFTPTDTSYTRTLDTQDSGGSNLVPAMYSSPPGYRAPSAGVAATSKDTTLTDILGNQVNATAASPPSGYAATQIDTGYIGSPAAPTSLLAKSDAVAAAAAGTRYYLSQLGVVPSSITVRDTTASANLVLSTDYAVTTSGDGGNVACYIILTAGTNFTAGDNITISYSYGDATYWGSNVPAAPPGAPTITAAVAVNRGAQVTWQPPAGTTPLDFYYLQCEDGGTMFVPNTGQPIEYGQPSPSGGGQAGEPTYQADTLKLLAAAISAPAQPVTATATTGGTVAAGTYTVVTTYVNSNGETVGSPTKTQVTTGSTSTLTVNSPGAQAGATNWYAYISQANGSTLTRQQAAGSPTLIGTNLVLTAPPTSTGANPPTLNTTLATTSKSGVVTPPAQLIVRDATTGIVLEYGYDYTVTQVGIGPWTQYQVTLATGSVNAAAGDSVIIEYWWTDPTTIQAVFTQGLLPNTPVIYKPDGTTPYTQGYRFKVAAGNKAGLGSWSGWSAYVVPLNYNEPQSNASITVGTGSLDPANTVNPIYAPDGTVKAGTGLGG